MEAVTVSSVTEDKTASSSGLELTEIRAISVIGPANEAVGKVPKQANVETERDSTRRVGPASNVVSFRLAVEILPWPATSPSIRIRSS